MQISQAKLRLRRIIYKTNRSAKHVQCTWTVGFIATTVIRDVTLLFRRICKQSALIGKARGYTPFCTPSDSQLA